MATDYSSAKDFKRSAFTDLKLPSGKMCAARRVGIDVFLKSGKVPNSLLPMMKGALKGNKQVLPTFDDIDMTMIADVASMFDLATIEAVQIPTVHPVPPRSEKDEQRYNEDGSIWVRDPDLLYVDEIDLEDKQFIFQWAIGGVTDVAKFRDGAKKELANIQASKGVGPAAKRPAKPRR